MRVFPRRHIVGVNIEKKYRVIRLIAGLVIGKPLVYILNPLRLHRLPALVVCKPLQAFLAHERAFAAARRAVNVINLALPRLNTPAETVVYLVMAARRHNHYIVGIKAYAAVVDVLQGKLDFIHTTLKSAYRCTHHIKCRLSD